jgi:hypothetical protein
MLQEELAIKGALRGLRLEVDLQADQARARRLQKDHPQELLALALLQNRKRRAISFNVHHRQLPDPRRDLQARRAAVHDHPGPVQKDVRVEVGDPDRVLGEGSEKSEVLGAIPGPKDKRRPRRAGSLRQPVPGPRPRPIASAKSGAPSRNQALIFAQPSTPILPGRGVAQGCHFHIRGGGNSLRCQTLKSHSVIVPDIGLTSASHRP